MSFSTAHLALWFLLANAMAWAGPVSTNSTTGSAIPQRSMLTMGGVATTPERKPSPHFDGSKLGVPPMQHSPWKVPETSLPTNYVSATRVLFEQGLADPRDCDYRVIEVGTGNVWGGDGGVVETHGWVLPGKTAEIFAVCWNGLVYPVVSVGTNADLDADVTQLVTNGMTTWRSVIPEAMTVSPQSLLGIKGCLLLRLGRADLATLYWQVQAKRGQDYRNEMWSRGMSASTSAINGNKLSEADPYFVWATEWAWAMFDRAICAHMRGDEALALVTARQLAEVQPKIEAECEKRGFKKQKYWGSPQQGKERPYLDFLDQLPQLLADLERRAKEGDRMTVIQSGLQNIPNQTERIAALIRDLDLVEARQWGQPGGVNLAQDPIVSALIQEGDPAVEPLLDCLETDTRLTRSVGFGRDFSTGRKVIPVNSAANSALLTILQAGFSGGAKEMRAYWNKYKNMNLDERCYAILKDDSARGRWLEAAAHITQSVNVTTFPGGFSTSMPEPTNAPVRLRGEALRGKSNPSVSELMARRALEIPEGDPNSYDLSGACEMGLKLSVWDAKAAEPVVKTLSKRCATVLKYSGAQMGGLLTKLSIARAKSGDPEAFDDYAAWLPTASPEQMGHSVLEFLAPLEQFPTNIVLRTAAEKMFADTNSVWSRLPWQKSGSDNPASSGLFNVPAFRNLLVRELDRKEVCGSVTWQSPGMVNYSMSNYWSGSFGYSFPEAPQTTNGTSADLRWCDWIALSLSNGKHIASYNPFAPIPQRNEALEKAKVMMRQ